MEKIHDKLFDLKKGEKYVQNGEENTVLCIALILVLSVSGNAFAESKSNYSEILTESVNTKETDLLPVILEEDIAQGRI